MKPVVLIVEDEPLTRMRAVFLAEDAGFEAVEASSADEAIVFLEARKDIREVRQIVAREQDLNSICVAMRSCGSVGCLITPKGAERDAGASGSGSGDDRGSCGSRS